jgi:alanine-alpha-ketoisovalerate/valine-pyruvate aminotransferase
MQQPFENPESSEPKAKSSRLTIGMGVLVAVAILLSLWFLFEPLQSKKSMVQEAVAVKMNPLEQDYAKKIEIGNVALSRAENFLHQEVTTLTGELYNGGSERVIGLSLTAEFSDDLNQIVLRETRSVVASPQVALGPGEHRKFEISFEHIPTSWNMQSPAVCIAHLQLGSQKH